jgi:hypothetical protein
MSPQPTPFRAAAILFYIAKDYVILLYVITNIIIIKMASLAA